MGTELYKEAVAEAKKLREVAEQDAKKAIIKELTPYIKETISEQISSNQFFFEQEDEEEDLGLDLAGSEPGGETPTPPEIMDTMSPDGLAPGLGDQPEKAPLVANGEDIIDATMPDEEGKITVDFEDLFAGEGEEIGVGDEPPVIEPGSSGEPIPGVGDEEEEEPVSFENFERSLYETIEKIDRAYFSEIATDITQESLKNKLLELLETIDKLVAQEKMSPKQAKINENKLEFLFLKLKEVSQPNSYIKREKNMSSLKEYAAKLLEIDEADLAEAVKEIRMKKSIKTKMNEASDGENAESWEDAEPKDGDDPAKEDLDNENKDMWEEKPAEEPWEEGEPEEKEASHEKLKEGLNEDDEELIDDVLPPEGEVDVDMDVAPEPEGDLVLSIDLPDEIEDALADVDISAMDDVDVELTDVNLGLEDAVEDVVEDEIVAAPEEEIEMEEQLSHMKEANEMLKKKHTAFQEKSKRTMDFYKKELKKNKDALKEAHLFLAKNVYFTKFMQRGDVSRKNLKKIAGYLDKANTVAEAKKIYGTIKVKLNEARTSGKLAGSASQVTKSGSAKTLAESKQPQNPNDPVINSVDRMKKLAGIKG